MTDRVDEFESIFKRAAKVRFHYACPRIDRIVFVTDEPAERSAGLRERLQAFLAVLAGRQPAWHTLSGADFDTKSELMALLDRRPADMIVSSRNLKQKDKNTPHSLGSLLDTLTQETTVPVLVLPDAAHLERAEVLADTSTVMVMTDHITADDRLINYGLLMTQPGGQLHLCHIEDDAVFQYYMAAIERIPAIETDHARGEIQEQLLKQPSDYLQSCIETVRETPFRGHIEAHVVMGHSLADYARLVEAQRVDMLILNTKDENQLAMHGQAYAVAVEFRHLPLLML